MKIALYQIIPELDGDRMMFQNLDYMRSAYGKEIPAQFYETIYTGDIAAENLEDVFRIFNVEFPKDYRGRSLSVSDVVEVIDSPEESRFYYCDTIGFEEVEFNKNKAMLAIVNHNFQRFLEIRHNVRIFFIGNDGLKDIHCSKLILGRCRYSQTQLGYDLKLFEFGEDYPISHQFLEKPLIVVTKCTLGLPENLFTDKEGIITKHHRYPVHSLEVLGLISDWITKCGFTFENL